jgi:hypothetical protein
MSFIARKAVGVLVRGWPISRPFRGYGAALSAGLPHALRVLDPFHVVRLGFACVDDVRRRVQQQTYGHRGHRGDPPYGIRRLLRRGAENLTTTAWARLLSGIEAGDERGQVAAAWVAGYVNSPASPGPPRTSSARPGHGSGIRQGVGGLPDGFTTMEPPPRGVGRGFMS